MTIDNRTKRSKGRRKALVWLMVVLVLAGLALAGYAGLRQREEPVAETPVEMALTLRPYAMTIAGPGSLEAGRSVDIGLPRGVSGTLLEIMDVGERVAAGQHLARLDPQPFERVLRDAEFTLERAEVALASVQANQANGQASMRQELQEAESRFTLAERELERVRQDLELVNRLVELGNESQAAARTAGDTHDDYAAELAAARDALTRLRTSQELQRNIQAGELHDAELSLLQARLSVEEAREDLGALGALAPFDGIIASVEAREGSSVNAGQVLLTLIDDSVLKLAVQIDETEINSVAAGQRARLTFDALPGEAFEGAVSAVAPVGRIESNIPIFDVTITLANPDGLLRPGMTAEAAIVIHEVAAAATLPSAAIRTVSGQQVLQLLVGDGAAETLPVTVVDTVGFNSVVTGEFPQGARVLLPAGTGTGLPAAGQGRNPAGGLGGGFPGGIPGGVPAGIPGLGGSRAPR